MKRSKKWQIIEMGLWLLLIALPLFVGLLWGAQFKEHVYVTLRYARNLAAGLGLTYDPVGSSMVPPLRSPFFSVLLSLFMRSGLDIIMITAVFTLLGWSTTIFSTRIIGKVLGYQQGSLVSASLLAINPWIITTIGGIIPWIIAMICLSAALLLQRRFLSSIITVIIGLLLIIPQPSVFPWTQLSDLLWPLLWSLLLITAGIGAQWLAAILTRRALLHTNEKQTLALLLSIVLISFGSFQLHRLWQEFRFRPLAAWQLEHEIASWLDGETQPIDTLVASEKIGFLANRRTVTPDRLAEPLENMITQSENAPDFIISHQNLYWQAITISPWFNLYYTKVTELNEPLVAGGPYTIWQFRNPQVNGQPRQGINARVPDRIRLLGYQIDPYLVSPGQPVAMVLYFQTSEASSQPIEPFTAIIRLNPYFNSESAPETWEIAVPQEDISNDWLPGQVFTDLITLPLPPSLEIGAYQFNISFKGSLSEELWPISLDNDINRLDRIPLGDLVVPWQGDLTGIEESLVNFDNKINLSGYEITHDAADSSLDVDLYWQPLAHMDRDYTVFVHVIDQDGNLIASHDSQPANGRFPTSTWREGMIVKDQHHIDLPAELPNDEYQIMTGVYLQSSGERLSIITQNDATKPSDALPLRQIHLP